MFHPRTVAAECNHQKYPHGVRRIIRRIPLPCLEFPHAGLLIDLPGTKTLMESLREYRAALEKNDLPELTRLLEEGKKRKEEVDGR